MPIAKQDIFVPFDECSRPDGALKPVKFTGDLDKANHLIAHNAIQVQGTPIDVEWLRQHYASQNTVQVRLPTSWVEAWGMDVRLPVPFDQITTEHLKEVVHAFFKEPDALAPCPGCGRMTWNRKHYPSQYRDERCSECWFIGFRKEQEKAEAKAQRALQRKLSKKKAEGFTHHLQAWIHPARGDDYMVEAYLKEKPTDAQIQATLKQRGSRVLNDYSVKEL